MDEGQFMELTYKGKPMGRIEKDKIVFFGTDLNEVIDMQAPLIEIEEDAVVFFEKKQLSISEKMIILKKMGFEFKK
jgi:hypothetical protein